MILGLGLLSPPPPQPTSFPAEASDITEQRQTILLCPLESPDLPHYFLSNFLSGNMNTVFLGVNSFNKFSRSSGYVTNPHFTHQSVLNLHRPTAPKTRLRRLLHVSSWLTISDQCPVLSQNCSFRHITPWPGMLLLPFFSPANLCVWLHYHPELFSPVMLCSVFPWPGGSLLCSMYPVL